MFVDHTIVSSVLSYHYDFLLLIPLLCFLFTDTIVPSFYSLWFLFSDSPYKFKVNFRQADNYPVDLYYVMDLSNSMKDDKEKLAELGDLLCMYHWEQKEINGNM